MDTVARAKAGAAARWGSQEAAKEALAEAPRPKVKSLIPAASRVPSDEPSRHVRPTDMCPHGREYKWCTLDICKAEVG